jgi:TPR repeat protein
MEFNPQNNPNWFIDKLTYYQAANSSNEAIKQNFLIRVAEFELIISDLRNKKPKDPLQHELILGRRGSGKSTLLRRIQVEIEEDKQLSAQFIAINLAEEQAAIYRLSDLWFEVLQELMLQLNSKRQLQNFDAFDEPQGYTRYLYSEIHQLLKSHKKRLVLLLDNLDRILENFNDDGHLLREILLNHNDLQIIGGSTRMDEHFWRYDKPFYEFFRRHRLEGLSFQEIHHLLNHWSEAMQLPVLHDYALRFRGKVEAIRIFTDGLPRALQFFIQILLHDSTLYGFDYLRKIMDKATPLYQERLNNLTAPERKIVLEMAFWWEACPTKVLVEKCRMEGKTISAYLKKLERYGIVETINTPTKNHLYRVSERFFNMWLIVTQGNPEQKRHAKYLTLFLETWYDAQDLKDLAVSHIEDLKTGKYGYDKALILSKAFSQSKFISVAERDELIDLTLKLSENDGVESELPRKYVEISKEIDKLTEEKKYEEALEKIEEIENEEDGVKFFFKGYFCKELNKNKEAEKYYLLAIEKGQVNALYNLANLYADKKEYKNAEKYYLKAIEKGHFEALNNLALVYLEQGKDKEAEVYFLKSIGRADLNARYNLANLYFKQGKLENAEKYYLEAIEEGHINALNHLANLYSIQNFNDKAEKFYLQAIEKNNVGALNNLASVNYVLNQKKRDALNYINRYWATNKDLIGLKNVILIEIWNGIFDNLDAKIEQVLKESNYENLDWFLKNLLYQEQKNLVLSLFESEAHGKALKLRYELLYYATLILSNKTEGNLLLKIPPEVLPTVEEIVADVKANQAFYAQ